MRTIGKRWPSDAPRWDYTATCDYCGAAFQRSKLSKLRNGLLACDRDARGRDERTLAELNVLASSEPGARLSALGGDHAGGHADASTGTETWSVTLAAPVGAEVIQTGVPTTIVWTAEGSYFSWRIEATTNDGVDWVTLADGADGALREYTWVPASGNSVLSRVRVTGFTSFQGSSYSDQSASVFELFDPTLSITYPAGGESLTLGVPVSVTWDVTGAWLTFSLSSVSSLGAETELVTSIPGGLTSYSWAPSALDTGATLLLRGYTPRPYSDASAGFDVVAPSVTLTAPNGGETLQPGQAYSVTWTPVGVFTGFSIEYSSNSGSSYPTSLATGVSGGASSQSVTIPDTANATSRIRVTGTHASGSASDASNADFTIASPPWTAVAASSLWYWVDAHAATDGGAPGYDISTIDNRSTLTGKSGIGDFLYWYHVNPGLFGARDFDFASLYSPGSSPGHTEFKAAGENGNHTYIARGDPGATGILNMGLNNDTISNRHSRLVASRTSVREERSTAYLGTVRAWAVSYAALSAGNHTFGVSFVRGSPNSTATLYVDGVNLGAIVNTTLDLTFGTTGQIRPNMTKAVSESARVYAFAGWSSALNDANHAAVHAFLEAIDP